MDRSSAARLWRLRYGVVEHVGSEGQLPLDMVEGTDYVVREVEPGDRPLDDAVTVCPDRHGRPAGR
ncbi:hypothetical protein D9753_01305 [Streptomyces dangxiongensis]|uniref:Uncharacterized protein n=1 Tax=Streptomyces dangxiongensis TaxID=1442032 RepID=A0A3G2J6J8_9ACTN|nr:hypothetical protein [Streptomyces dangxiongensis]AYN37823.1 hypothetical protein D9753_01305 [Streptomyces dangxiongensis]